MALENWIQGARGGGEEKPAVGDGADLSCGKKQQ